MNYEINGDGIVFTHTRYCLRALNVLHLHLDMYLHSLTSPQCRKAVGEIVPLPQSRAIARQGAYSHCWEAFHWLFTTLYVLVVPLVTTKVTHMRP